MRACMHAIIHSFAQSLRSCPSLFHPVFHSFIHVISFSFLFISLNASSFHSMSFNLISLIHFIRSFIHYISFHLPLFHLVPMHVIWLHVMSYSLHTISCHWSIHSVFHACHCTSCPSTSNHFTSWHPMSFNFITFQSISFPFFHSFLSIPLISSHLTYAMSSHLLTSHLI